MAHTVKTDVRLCIVFHHAHGVFFLNIRLMAKKVCTRKRKRENRRQIDLADVFQKK